MGILEKRKKTAMELLGVRKYIRYYRSGMLMPADKRGETKYENKDDLYFSMQIYYAFHVATYEAGFVYNANCDLRFNTVYDEIVNWKWSDVEADAMARRLRGEPWLNEFKECF